MRNVCDLCFNDIELKQFISSNSKKIGICDYCHSEHESHLIDIKEILDFFVEFISIFKPVAKGKTLLDLVQSDWNIFSKDSVCRDILADTLLEIKSPILTTLQSVEYIDEITECVSYWELLKEEVKWNSRFFTNINKLEELGWHHLFIQTVELSKSDSIFRARLHSNGDQRTFAVTEMGSPPRDKSLSGRANPQGIPFLYLSKDITTTLYEVRATYLDEVSIGIFKIKDDSNVILVDFTEIPSAFLNIDKIVEYTKSLLLKRNVSIDLSKPIRRFDTELEYIPTQLICEYIRYITNADGILFNSSLHNGGKNIVLFEQDKTECISVKLHKVTKIEIESQLL